MWQTRHVVLLHTGTLICCINTHWYPVIWLTRRAAHTGALFCGQPDILYYYTLVHCHMANKTCCITTYWYPAMWPTRHAVLLHTGTLPCGQPYMLYYYTLVLCHVANLYRIASTVAQIPVARVLSKVEKIWLPPQ